MTDIAAIAARLTKARPPNPRAFPHPSGAQGCDGMTLRDWYAGQVIGTVVIGMQSGDIGDHPTAGGGPSGFAASAYEIADAMLIERNRK